MDPSHDSHRELNDLRRAGAGSRMHQFFPSRKPPEPKQEQLVAESRMFDARATNQSLVSDEIDLSPEQQPSAGNERALVYSWLLVLLVAPVIGVLLIWLLILLRRKLRQAHHLVSSMCSSLDEKPKVSHSSGEKCNRREEAVNEPRAQKQIASQRSSARTRNTHYLLESSSAISSSSTSSSGPSSSDEVSGNEEARKHRVILTQLYCLRSLVNHTNLYLLTLTYQEIIGCLVAFTIAILNIVRMRNLFCCNLVIFILVASKLLNLLTLTTFSLTKLIKLFRFKADQLDGDESTSISCQDRDEDGDRDENDRGEEEDGDANHLDEDGLDDLTGAKLREKLEANGRRRGNLEQQCSTFCQTPSSSRENTLEVLQVTKGSDKGAAKGRSCSRSRAANCGRGEACSSPYDPNATICRLIVEDADRMGKCGRLEDSCSSLSSVASSSTAAVTTTTTAATQPAPPMAPLSERLWSTRSSRQAGNSKARESSGKASEISEPIAIRLLVLVVISSSVSLICLYLRLMPTGGLLLPPADLQHLNSRTANRSSYGDWTISIYAPSTTTEASTRYSSESLTTNQGLEANKQQQQQPQQQEQQPNYQASWSARFQQSSHLRHLIDQYELQNFIHLLFDTQLQSSRFMCTLATSNYAPIAKLSMLTLYATLMLTILAASLAIQQLGSRRLRQLKASLRLPPLFSNYLLAHAHQYPIDVPQILLGSKQTDSNRKRYSELLKQNMRHHQCTAGAELSACQFVGRSGSCGGNGSEHRSRKSARHGSRLRNSCSMSSLLMATTSTGCHLSSIDRFPPLQSIAEQRASSRQQSQWRRAANAQSMSNLSNVSQPRPCSPVSRLFGSKMATTAAPTTPGAQLAWLPLGSAATVASLSNIGRHSADEACCRGSGSNCLRASSGKNSRPNRLRAIGEHQLSCSPLDERDERQVGEICALNQKQSRRSSNKDSKTLELEETKLTPDQRAKVSPATMTTTPTTSTSSGSTSAKSNGRFPLCSSEQRQNQRAAEQRFLCVEFKKDLRLTQTAILFGQLLNHAPILVSIILTLVSFTQHPTLSHFEQLRSH